MTASITEKTHYNFNVFIKQLFYNCYNKSVIAFNNRLSSATAVGVKKQV